MARAKINLALHVTGQRADGYHLLDSLVCFTNFGDELTFEPDDRLTLTVSGPAAGFLSADRDNLVVRAAEMLRNHVNLPGLGAAIGLHKKIPVASGLGGGSSNAATTLGALCRLWNLDLNKQDLGQLAVSLGADVPVCLTGKSSRIGGIGEQLQPVDIDKFFLVLVNPRIGLHTPQIFASTLKKDNPAMDYRGEGEPWHTYLKRQRNDLQQAAIAAAPSIAECLAALDRLPQCRLARMSGSGATCFGIFDTRQLAKRAAASLQDSHPQWWVVDTETVR